MSITGITTNNSQAAVSSAISNAASSATSGSNNLASQLGPNEFLQLLTTQLANQDPLNPMDDTQSVAQLAQFSQLQASDNLETSFTSFNQNFGILQSAGIIGKSVTINNTSGGGTQSGTVSAVDFANGAPSFTLTDSNGNTLGSNYNLSQILSINS